MFPTVSTTGSTQGEEQAEKLKADGAKVMSLWKK